MRYLVIALSLLFAACATPPEAPKDHSHREKLYMVVQLCRDLGAQHLKDPRYTDCRIAKDRIHFVFANQATYMGEAQVVSSMVQTFCYASQGAAQRPLNLQYSWFFTEEKRGTARGCPKLDFAAKKK